MEQLHRKEVWDSGDAYEPYVGRWSRRVAHQFLAWIAVAPGSSWLDVGCGTGALSQTIVELAAPREVSGIDPSPSYIAYARNQLRNRCVHFRVGDALSLPYKTATFDAVVSGLVLNFIPSPGIAVSEMVRVVRPGGTVASYVWDYAGQMQLMRHFWNAVVALDPTAVELDEGRRFSICQPGPLEQLFRDAGLKDVEMVTVDVPTDFRDFDDYWSPFLGGQAPAPSYAMSLSEEHRILLRERIRAGLPIAEDGSIHLIARAWAVRGLHDGS